MVSHRFRPEDLDRRSYLKALGAGSLVGLSSTTGCVSVSDDGGSGDGGDGSGGDGAPRETNTPAEDGTETEDGEGTTTDESTGPTRLTAGTAPGFPPFEMNQGGELTGFDVELLEAVVAAAPGYELDGWQEFEFSSLIPALRNDRIDVIAAAMTITDDRDETIDFTDPYFNADQAILVRADGDFQPSSLSDLSGHPIGAQEGTTGEQVIESELIDAGELEQSDYQSYDSYVLAVQDLQNRNIDAVVLDRPVANTFASQRPVEIAFTYETGERYGFGVRDGDDDLRQALNEGLGTVQDDGTYAELETKWFTGSESTTEPATQTASGS